MSIFTLFSFAGGVLVRALISGAAAGRMRADDARDGHSGEAHGEVAPAHRSRVRRARRGPLSRPRVRARPACRRAPPEQQPEPELEPESEQWQWRAGPRHVIGGVVGLFDARHRVRLVVAEQTRCLLCEHRLSRLRHRLASSPLAAARDHRQHRRLSA